MKIEMNEWLLNSGILGFARMLGDNVDITQKELYIDKQLLLSLDLTQLYFDAFIDKYKEETSFAKCRSNIKIILTKIKENSLDLTKDKVTLDFVKEKLKSSSYLSAYESIKNKINNYDYPIEIKKIDIKSSDLNNQLSKLSDFMDNEIVSKTFIMKNIVYTVIGKFWNGKAFLTPSNSKKDMMEVFRKDFELPFKEYLSKESNGQYCCASCGDLIEKKDFIKPTFMCNLGDDFTRKRSSFWNFEINSFICPKCAFIYACTPLGFSKANNDFIFINNNSSLSYLNDNNKLNDMEIENNDPFYLIFSKIDFTKDTKIISQLDNTQVIIYDADTGKYRFSILGKEKLRLIKYSKKYLKKLSEKNNYLYKIAIKNILDWKDNYNDIFKQFIENIEKEYWLLIYYLVKIQLIKDLLKRKGDEFVEKELKHLNFNQNRMIEMGNGLRSDLLMNGTNKKALIGISYKLLTYARLEKYEDFFDYIIRLYNNTKTLSMPNDLKILKKDDNFKTLAISFVFGLRSEKIEKDNKEEVKENE